MPVGNPIYTDYEPLADDNQAAAPTGAPEGSYQGRWVNDTFRHMMAVIRRLGDGVLQLDGSTSPTADIDFGGFVLRNVGRATNRTAAARNDDMQDQVFNWGGTTTGTGAAYTVVLTPLHTQSTYRPGTQVRAIMHATNTSTTPTLNAGTAGPKTIVHRNGAALGLGDLRINTRYTFEFDGTNWRAIDAGGFMDQQTYDDLYPVGFCKFLRDTSTPVVPSGVTATWAMQGNGAYLRATTGTPGSGGSLNTSADAHTHTFSDTATTSQPTNTGGSPPVGLRTDAVGHTHTVSVSGTTSSDSHSHTIEPTYISGRLWQRTA